jgi:uncharacterized protein (TIGR02246 family)
MISKTAKISFAMFLLATMIAAPAWAQMASGSEADAAAIKQCVSAWENAWNSHDAHTTAMKYTEDGDFTNTTGIPSHGWNQLEAHYNEIFTTFLKDAHRTDTVKSIRFLNAENASVDIDWQMTGARTRDGKDAPNRKGLLTWIVTKRNGEWKILIYHEQAF